MTTPQLAHRRAPRATAIVLTTMLMCALALFLHAARAGAAAYPPPPPSATATATCAPSSSSGSSSSGCGVGPVTTTSTQSAVPPNSPLAETGFNSALALAVVGGLVGVGGVCLYAGTRRRRY